MKNNLQSKVDNFSQALSKFSERWEALKPKNIAFDDRQAALDAVTTIKERRLEFDALAASAKSIEHECNLFGLPQPVFDVMHTVDAEITGMQETWQLFEEFLQGLDVYTRDEWISVRGRMPAFAEFLDGWAAKLKNQATPTVVSMSIRSDLEKYQTALPLLRLPPPTPPWRPSVLPRLFFDTHRTSRSPITHLTMQSIPQVHPWRGVLRRPLGGAVRVDGTTTRH